MGKSGLYLGGRCLRIRTAHPSFVRTRREERGRSMKLSLIVLTEGKSAGKAIPITLSQFLIGRDPQCNLRPASAMISKRHCAVLVKGGRVFVRDFGSTNGTFINNDRVQGEHEMKHDDILKVGPLDFRVALSTATPTPVNKPTPVPPKANAPQHKENLAATLLSL